MTEKKIIRHPDSSERSEIERVYVAHRQEFVSWAVRSYNCTVDDAKEIYQQSIIIFYENMVQGKINDLRSKVKTYLFAIGKNKFREKWRKDKKYESFEPQETLLQADDLLLEYAEKEEQLKIVEACLEKLGDPCKNILRQFYYHQKSMQDISDLLEYKNAETVKNLKYKCLQRLKRIFHDEAGLESNGI